MKYNALSAVGARNTLDGPDFFPTPPIATVKLLDFIDKHEPDFPNYIWEPSCGDGAVSELLLQRGYKVHSTDLHNWNYDKLKEQVDFFKAVKPDGVDAIITNPPYNIATEYIEKAITDVRLSAFLLRLQFVESKKRDKLMDTLPPKYILPFRSRLPRMHRFGYEGKKTTSTVCFAWFIWDRNYSGYSQLIRL